MFHLISITHIDCPPCILLSLCPVLSLVCWKERLDIVLLCSERSSIIRYTVTVLISGVETLDDVVGKMFDQCVDFKPVVQTLVLGLVEFANRFLLNFFKL